MEHLMSWSWRCSFRTRKIICRWSARQIFPAQCPSTFIISTSPIKGPCFTQEATTNPTSYLLTHFCFSIFHSYHSQAFWYLCIRIYLPKSNIPIAIWRNCRLNCFCSGINAALQDSICAGFRLHLVFLHLMWNEFKILYECRLNVALFSFVFLLFFIYYS